jgi:hypothetical protein
MKSQKTSHCAKSTIAWKKNKKKSDCATQATSKSNNASRRVPSNNSGNFALSSAAIFCDYRKKKKEKKKKKLNGEIFGSFCTQRTTHPCTKKLFLHWPTTQGKWQKNERCTQTYL